MTRGKDSYAFRAPSLPGFTPFCALVTALETAVLPSWLLPKGSVTFSSPGKLLYPRTWNSAPEAVPSSPLTPQALGQVWAPPCIGAVPSGSAGCSMVGPGMAAAGGPPLHRASVASPGTG